MRKCVVLIALLWLIGHSMAQTRDSVFVLPDTAKPLTLEDFYRLILKYHPVAKQVNLLSDVARQEIRLARGSFDPKLEVAYLMKHYNQTEYYRLFNGSVKLPTRSPVTPSVGLERNKGEYLNPEKYISDEYNYQQIYAGISIPLGQGLMTDERRTALKQAELFSDMTEAEQIKVINKLLLEAAKSYWDWYYSYYNYRLATNTVRIADDIFKRTKANFEGGEIAAIDTTQAKIILFEREVNRQEALTSWQNSTINISTFLWDSLMNPVDVAPQLAPVNETELVVLSATTLEELVNQAKTNHPELRKLNLKVEQLELDRRLASEYLKPKLDLSYYMLNQPFYPEGVNNNFTFNDNFKLGVDFSFPIFLRKERAKVAQTKLKLTTTQYDLQLAQRQIINDINAAYNQVINYGIIVQQQRAMADNYIRLVNAELLNLENGESDLFKINVQQEKLFNAQSKLIKVMADYEKQKAILYWSAGVRLLPDN
ncbi:TolC family protein [Chryseosolibacter indicus]|uniref:TolC family protein n=1 Tax=Chryseosolibacter indicus TaxID=2782351 RepID=A0ABS5VWF7_9BACT|nr:TolC family protein [Chryseosolibacter indicus]MBT1705760.1 TolC family protein [Chryseosolibacter indicus]